MHSELWSLRQNVKQIKGKQCFLFVADGRCLRLLVRGVCTLFPEILDIRPGVCPKALS